MAKKQTFVVGSTNPVTQSRTDAELNTAWNQFEVLKAGELDGVLNAMSAQTKIDSEEITNALDVYNITPNPNDNTQLKQVLTQMDNKIDQVVSGGEIIGSFWYGKTTAGFTVPAPTQIGQTYLDFTTLEHYISNDGSTWTLNGTLTLPALQDAIVLITSKFWDIIEQQNQYGGRAIWSYDLSQWIYYPTIISVDFSQIYNAIYPVGSLYTTTDNSGVCPIASLIPGSTWQLVATDRALWGGNGSNAATTIAAGLPNITGGLYEGYMGLIRDIGIANGCFSKTASRTSRLRGEGGTAYDVGFAASNSSSVFGQSTTVQPPAYRVNVWRRVS